LSVFALLLLTGCGGNDLDEFIGTKECVECDLAEANLSSAHLHYVIGGDFTGALNVGHFYTKD
jgi:hypothetical protein